MVAAGPGWRHTAEHPDGITRGGKGEGSERARTPAAPPGGPLGDPYVRRNIAALEAIEIARGALSGGDSRIYPALCRRGLVWEEPVGCWHLTAAGSGALDAWDAERAEETPGA